MEANYIKLYKPKYNAKLTDGKAYPLIRITYNDKYPKVLIARRHEDKKSIYLGPFPNSSALRLVLRTIRRIFPFQSVVNHPNKLCFYNHLNLCPCPQITKDKYYKKNIQHVITFLKGNTKKVVSSLEKERSTLSKLEEFERAEVFQRKIDAINYITSYEYKKFDYKTNPNLEEDLRYKELLEFKISLLAHNVSVKSLDRIECYDISNILGTNAAGSMVVFTNGEKDTSQYRRFKIKNLPNFPTLPNDYAMMQQVISRRLNHTEWSMPDLIIVDGGKGQVSSVINILKERQINIPVIGLAKREETIIIPPNLVRHSGKRSASRISKGPILESQASPDSQNDEEEKFIEMSLPKDSPALHLIMRIRDEAHRLAITYHKKLRSKGMSG